MGGIASSLGGAEAPPPPPPVPPPPPIPACIDGPFVVYFDWANDEIGPQARAVLDNAASAYQICRQAQVIVAGHADRSGPDPYNVGLSQRRATNVRAYLAGRGIPDGAMTTVALGESRLQIDTADGVREPLNRRVEITFGPGSDE
jgi:outer membrane protein OmpA-like peptidoglycan-associated protein